MLPAICVATEIRAFLPAPSDPRLTARELARRRTLAALVPRLVVRFTWRSSADWTAYVFDTRADAADWPVSLGATFELRAIWSLEPPGASVLGRVHPVFQEEP